MICKKPFMSGALPFPCGQCIPCRIARRKLWTTRQVLEAMYHDENAFLTLTYSDTNLPGDGSLDPTHLSAFIKRLRARVSPTTFRFYAVGEYGDATQRPHYHLSVFGLSGRTDILSRSAVRHHGCSRLVYESWGLGHTFTAEFTRQTAQYVSGYVVKKLTSRDDPRLQGRAPEFARMSLRPGIGAVAVASLAASLNAAPSLGDGRIVRINGKKEYIGPYLLRLLTAAREPDASKVQAFKDEKSYERSLEMLALLEGHKNDTQVVTVRQAFQKSVYQKVLAAETKEKIFSKKGTL